MIDTHIHLYSEEFDEDREEVISQAMKVGVETFYLPAIDSNYHQRMWELELKHPNSMKLMMGLHPVYVKEESYKAELEKVYLLLNERPFAAIGEIGIDLYWDSSTLDIQKEAFKQQIAWAKQLQLPIVIHARESFQEIFEILESKESAGVKGIFHCFTGNLEQANRAIDLGFLLGIGGVVTYKNGKLDEFLSQIPLKNIVLETDAPYLSPVPYRGKRNEPKYLVEIMEKLVTIYQIPPNEIKKITTENAKKIFAHY